MSDQPMLDLDTLTPAPRPAQRIETLEVRGTPAPQGSKKAFVNRHTGRAVMVEQTAKRLTPWRQDVMQAALEHIRVTHTDAPGREPWVKLDGPLVARIVFTLRKPASAPKTRRTWPDRTPDLSKLLRSTEDALTNAGFWADDARVIGYDRAAKVFPGEDPDALEVPGCRITVWQVTA